MARILVIDDDGHVRNAVRRALEVAGHTVIDTPNGDTGLGLLRDQPADLLITDIFMPDRDGLEIIRHVRREYPRMRIIAISGGDRTQRVDLRRDAELLGASRTLRKPFDSTQLLRIVHELVGPPGSEG